jgi:glycosyltransferase involved in cell wall biosynthesis
VVKIVSLDKAPTSDITIFESKIEGREVLGTISIPVRDHINAATATSIWHTDWSFMPKDTAIERFIVQGNILTLQRNESVQRMRGDWLLFIDDDMVWEPDAIGRLIAARDEIDADIMGALCYRRSAPHQPTLFMRELPTSGGYNYMEDWDDDIIEVDATGMAFVLIHKRVFEKIAGIPMPPYDLRRALGPSGFFRWEGVLGEDLRFCQDAKNAGCRIFVDTRIEVGHMAEVEIRRRHFLMESLGRTESESLSRRTINDRMGLPTLTTEQIKARLGW